MQSVIRYMYVGNIIDIRVRPHIIGDESIETVGKSQPCMVSELPIICEQTVMYV